MDIKIELFCIVSSSYLMGGPFVMMCGVSVLTGSDWKFTCTHNCLFPCQSLLLSTTTLNDNCVLLSIAETIYDERMCRGWLSMHNSM